MGLLSGAAGLSSMVPASIQRAMAINPSPGSTYMDAEHVVILMQENRAFDHTFGTLKGVRGYNDPRAITLPDGNPVWLQSNGKGETFVPFHFDIRNTKATWMGAVPHSRSSQVDAWNQGRYDNWINAKRVNNKKLAEMPLTMGYYTRKDIPFYYALADNFTICDQNFCSAVSPTRPNRLFFWTGTIRPEQDGRSKAHIRNGDEGYGTEHWKTFPERLEENDISWKFYQNDIDCGGGFTGDQRAWLGNFGCNPLEWFANYNVKFSPRYIKSLQEQVETLPGEIEKLQHKTRSKSASDPSSQKIKRAIAKKQEVLGQAKKELAERSRENFDKLSDREKSLYRRAFATNGGNPDFHKLTTLKYEDEGQKRELPVPQSDPLYQFRKDVESDRLPTVSWLAGAQNFSSHPSAPWYGSLYISEMLDILTQNPEVWKKTIFIVTFDENDGYFDHVPPFVAPDPRNPKTGKCSNGISTEVEYIYREDELAQGVPKGSARTGPVGLGFRVPMIVASPWSRGGQVSSQVFDHTSTLQFLEGFLSKKFNKDIRETNIGQWRRAICGDLTSLFRPYNSENTPQLPFLKKDPFIEKIYNAKFKKTPDDFRPLSKGEIAEVNKDPWASGLLPRQEPGSKPSCAVPYEIYVAGKLTDDKKDFEITLTAKNEVFGNRSLGAPFNVYASGDNRSYAVTVGDSLADSWPITDFDQGIYGLKVHGPNGFFREYGGSSDDPRIGIICGYERPTSSTEKLTGNIELQLANLDPDRSYTVNVQDNAYQNGPIKKTLEAGSPETTLVLDLEKSHGWYDFSIGITGFEHFGRRYAGHVETGRDSFSDPAMGKVLA